MRVTDGAERKVKIHRRIFITPVVGDFAQAIIMTRADIIQSALAAAEFLAQAREAGAQQNNAVRVIAFLHDDRFFFGSHSAGLREALVFAGPIVVAVSRELDLLGHAVKLLLSEMLEHRRGAEIRSERAFAVDFVDVRAQAIAVFHQVAQTLPADFQKLGIIAVGKNGGRAWHPAQRADFAEQISRRHLLGAMRVQHARQILKKNANVFLRLTRAEAGGLLQLRVRKSFRRA